MFDYLLSVIAPHYCCNCGRIGRPLCNNCKKYINNLRFKNCVLCGKQAKNSNICQKHKASYDNFWCAFYREGPISKLIDDYKFQRVKAAAMDLAEVLDYSLPEFPKNSVLVPIPTAPKNVRQRGYDHMLLIVKILAKRRKMYHACLLARKNNTVQHFAKTVSERRKNAKNFFEVRSEIDSKINYVVVDDIFTTGSTIDAAVKTLRKAGAKRIDAVVIARHDKYYRHS